MKFTVLSLKLVPFVLVFFKRISCIHREQFRLRDGIITEDDIDWSLDSDDSSDSNFQPLRLVAGVDLFSSSPQSSRGCVALSVLEFPSLQVVYEDCQQVALEQPYIAGFLAFREVRLSAPTGGFAMREA